MAYDNEIMIDLNIVIDNPEEMRKAITRNSGIENIDLDEIADFIKTEKNTKLYFDTSLKGQQENSPKAKYLWLDTGVTDCKGNPLFVSLINRNGYYTGHYIGNSYYLANKMIDFVPENKCKIEENEKHFKDKYQHKIEQRTKKNLMGKFENEEPKPVVKTKTETNKKNTNDYYEKEKLDITKDVQAILMFNNWRTANGLERYLKVIGRRVIQLVEKGRNEYYILNKLGSAVINTGLLDKYGSYIHLIYRKNLYYDFFVPYRLVESKKDYAQEGFSPKQILPITFFDEDNRYFNASIEQFDITHRALAHIIQERRSRFPEHAKDMSDMVLTSMIHNALEIGLKLQSIDPTYVKPSYSAAEGTISWMMPFHVESDFSEEPELVLVLREADGYYEIKTILPYDDEVKDKFTDLSLYGRLW